MGPRRGRLRITGDGAHTVVIVPDPRNTLEHYDELIDLLVARGDVRVVCFEVPGFGLITLAWGHADRTHARTDPRSLLTVVPHARFVAFERCGHFPDLEDPRRFAGLVFAGWEGA